jgi:hypothetical protein
MYQFWVQCLAPTDRDLLPSPRCGMVIGASIATLMLMR